MSEGRLERRRKTLDERVLKDNSRRAIEAGRASPTPEFAAELASKKERPVPTDATEAVQNMDVAEGRAMMRSLERQMRAMSVTELDAFIQHLGNLLPLLQMDERQAYSATEWAANNPVNIAKSLLSQLLGDRQKLLGKFDKIKSEWEQKAYKEQLINELLTAARDLRSTVRE